MYNFDFKFFKIVTCRYFEIARIQYKIKDKMKKRRFQFKNPFLFFDSYCAF